MPLPPSRPPLTSFLRKRTSSATGSSAGSTADGTSHATAGRVGNTFGATRGSGSTKMTKDVPDGARASWGATATGTNTNTNTNANANATRFANNPNTPNTSDTPPRFAAKPAAGVAPYARRASVTASAGAAVVRSSSRGAAGVLEFLRIDDKMAALLPAATRMAALQADCAALLPEMFNTCAVLQFADELLVLAVPNAAIAARLRQRLPNLQQTLLQRGWQVKAVRLKVQVGANVPKPVYVKQAIMPQRALTAMADLESALEDEPRNAPLKAALATLLRHQRKPG